MNCPHPHLRFEDGAMHIVCIDCGQVYGALDRKGGITQPTAAAEYIDPFRATRHDRWELARTEPIKKPSK